MTLEVLYVLQKEGRWPVMHQDAQNIKEQRALRFVIKPMRPAESVFLGDSGNRERLTRESSNQNIMVWNVSCLDIPDIACYGPIVREVGMIGRLSETVPF